MDKLDKKEQIKEAKDVIDSGGIVIFPTETAYGLAADATNEKAVEKVYEAKNRSRSKGLTTIVSDFDQAKTYGDFSEKERTIIDEFMPGPLTLVADKNQNNELPENLNENFVFRISSSDLAGELASNTPITATSANISGKETSYCVEDISSELKVKVNYILDRGQLEQKPTSSIIELKDDEVIVHREGPITKEDILDRV